MGLNKGGIMKRYLFGLGAMLVGAGLMFVLMHEEVSADSKPEPFACSDSTRGNVFVVSHCETRTLDCAVTMHGLSCEDK